MKQKHCVIPLIQCFVVKRSRISQPLHNLNKGLGLKSGQISTRRATPVSVSTALNRSRTETREMEETAAASGFKVYKDGNKTEHFFCLLQQPGTRKTPFDNGN